MAGGVIINPGSEDLNEGTEENAIENMKHFIVDCNVEDLQFLRYEDADDYGRFAFLVFVSTKYHSYDRVHIIHMPGLTLDRVRYTQGKNPWNYPRLYMDWSSWLWTYALLEEKDFKKCGCQNG
jgi:hypothetical protein